MNIFDGIEKLINEHGSAAILRDHVALFKDQLSILKEKFAVLEAENQNLKTETQNLKMENEQLKKRIQINKNPTHNRLLDEITTKMLVFLWKQQEKITDKEISQALSIDFQIVKYHLVELEENKMIHGTLASGQPRLWSLIQGGRKYLIENKLN